MNESQFEALKTIAESLKESGNPNDRMVAKVLLALLAATCSGGLYSLCEMISVFVKSEMARIDQIKSHLKN